MKLVHKLLAAATLIGTPAISSAASAAPVLVHFAGLFDNDGTAANSDRGYTADVTLDVANGMASSGSGTFTFHNMTHILTLVTVDTPDNHNVDPDYPVGLKSNGGDNVFGTDQIFPLTSIGGLLFAADTTAPADFSSALLNFYNNSGTLVVGAYGTPRNDVRLYTGGTLTATVVDATAAVPEPAAWAMMILGMGAIGYSMRRRKIATRVSYAA